MLTAGSANFSLSQPSLWLTPRAPTVTVPVGADRYQWLLVNPQQIGE